jgi:fructose-bisphosphate aldolase, class I
MNGQELIDTTARTLVAGNKGLLAMDESDPACNKRFARLGIPQTEEALVLAAQQALNHRARCNRAA